VTEKRGSTVSSSGVGLKSMYNRARLIGADISINSEPANGTAVFIKLFIPEER
jgi:signal transduction histidine kinase